MMRTGPGISMGIGVVTDSVPIGVGIAAALMGSAVVTDTIMVGIHAGF